MHRPNSTTSNYFPKLSSTIVKHRPSKSLEKNHTTTVEHRVELFQYQTVKIQKELQKTTQLCNPKQQLPKTNQHRYQTCLNWTHQNHL